MAAVRISTPPRTACAATDWTARRAISAPLPGSWMAHVMGPRAIWGQRDSSSVRASFSYRMPSRVSVARVARVSESSPRAIQSTPVSWKSFWPLVSASSFHRPSDRCDQRVYSSSAPYPMRITRVSPPELARLLPGP